MPLRDSRVLVTGADGFIGSHLTEELVRQGRAVRALVFYNSMGSWGWLDNLPAEVRSQIEVVAGDIRDPDVTHHAVKGCGVIFHLASLIAIPFSYLAPASYFETNVKGTLNVLQAARALGVEKIVHTSTSEVYGSARFVPITEEHPLRAQSPYAASKIAADQLALSFQASFDTPVAVIRPFNVYGPRQSARAFIASLVIQALTGGGPVRLGALHPTRDFSFVSDTVSGFLAVAGSAAAVGEVCNIGSNFEISMGEAVQTLAEVLGREIEIVTDESRLRPERSEVTRLWADNAKARRLLGWQPAYQGLEGFRRGLEQTVAWFSRPENLRHYRLDGVNTL